MYLIFSKHYSQMNLLKFLKYKPQFLLGIIIVFLVALSDLFSKRIIFSILDNIALEENVKNPEIVITSFFSLVKVLNYGISFGMFNTLPNSQIIFCLIQLTIAFILFFWLFNSKKTYLTVAISFIIGGAFGNLIDRARYGAVADFLDFHINSYHWPAFNLADSFVFIGVTILLLDDLVLKKDKK